MFDINKLKGFAQKQREQDNASEETPKGMDEPTQKIDEDIYIPIDENEEIPPIPDEYDEYLKTQAVDKADDNKESTENLIEKCFPEKAYNIDIERLVPYRKNIFVVRTDDELVKDINRHGITEPLLVRSIGNGEYEVISGGKRRNAAEHLSWTKVPCRIADNDILTDEMADMIVVQSNKHRFPELSLPEIIRVSAILDESAPKELNITPEQAQKYAVLNGLIQPLLIMLGDNTLPAPAAEILAEIPQSAQKKIYDVANGEGLKITPFNASELAKAKRLTEDNILKILTAKPKPAPKVVVPPEVVEKYLPGKTAKEAEEIIEQALAAYVKE